LNIHNCELRDEVGLASSFSATKTLLLFIPAAATGIGNFFDRRRHCHRRRLPHCRRRRRRQKRPTCEAKEGPKKRKRRRTGLICSGRRKVMVFCLFSFLPFSL